MKRKVGRTMKLVRIVFVAVFCVLMIAGSAYATPILDGKDITIRYLYPDMNADFFAPVNVVVGPGVEANFGSGTPLVDISDTNIYFDFSISGASGAFNGFQFIDYTSTINSFSTVSIAGTNLAFDASRITFDDDNIWVNFQGLASGSDGYVSLDVTAGNTVPEPGTIFLLGSGLVGLVGLRKKTQS